MQSRVFRPLVYSIKNGFRANELTNQGSDLMSPVYKTALPSPSNTIVAELDVGNFIIGEISHTEHHCTCAMICIEQSDLNIFARLQFDTSRRLQGNGLLEKLLSTRSRVGLR
jgi:hypothetical protein